MLGGMLNLWKEGEEGGYAVWHGQQFVSNFGWPRTGDNLSNFEAIGDSDQPNYFERTFLCLFPYGVGGLEADRQVVVDFQDHIKWALDYHDHCFGRHKMFPFVAFGIVQQCQVLYSAWLQMHWKIFDTDARLLSTIMLNKLEKAHKEKEDNLPISDPAVCLLQKHIHATGGCVMVSDQAQYQLLSQIWSTSIYLNLPSLWITIKPGDSHDPIAQVFCSEEINLDNFVATMGSPKERHTQNIAGNPYGAVKFFHFLIRTVLTTLFSIETTKFKVKVKMGVFGWVQVYFGVVESQNHGNLHLHLLVWMEGAPTSDEMHKLLQEAEFHACILVYIWANLQASAPGLNLKTDMKGNTKWDRHCLLLPNPPCLCRLWCTASWFWTSPH